MSGAIEQSGIYKAIAVGLVIGLLVGMLGGYAYGWIVSNDPVQLPLRSKAVAVGLNFGIPAGLALGLLGGIVCWGAVNLAKLFRRNSD